jgi:hypothetical protein
MLFEMPLQPPLGAALCGTESGAARVSFSLPSLEWSSGVEGYHIPQRPNSCPARRDGLVSSGRRTRSTVRPREIHWPLELAIQRRSSRNSHSGRPGAERARLRHLIRNARPTCGSSGQAARRRREPVLLHNFTPFGPNTDQRQWP